MMGALAAKLSETKRLGIIAGAEEPFINNEMNGFLDGVRDACTDCEVDVAFVGKGITFFSGGISIKPSEKMEEM